MADANTIRAQFEQFQLDIQPFKLRAQRLQPLEEAATDPQWEVVTQPGRIGLDWDRAVQRFQEIAASAASALLNDRGRSAWMRWVERIWRANPGDVVKVTFWTGSSIHNIEGEDGAGQRRDTRSEHAEITDVVQGSILLCDAILGTRAGSNAIARQGAAVGMRADQTLEAWKSLETEFKSLSDGVTVLAFLDTTDLKATAAKLRADLTALQKAEGADSMQFDNLTRMTESAEHAAATHLLDPRGTWSLMSVRRTRPGASEPAAALKARFRSLAMRAAIAAGVSAALDLFQEWLFIVQVAAPEYCDEVNIRDVFEASAHACDQLGTRALVAQAALGAAAALPQSNGQAQTDTIPQKTNRERVDDYLADLYKKTGKRHTRKEIWGPHYDSATEFQRWQRNDKRTTRRARDLFEGIVSRSPRESIE